MRSMKLFVTIVFMMMFSLSLYADGLGGAVDQDCGAPNTLDASSCCPDETLQSGAPVAGQQKPDTNTNEKPTIDPSTGLPI